MRRWLIPILLAGSVAAMLLTTSRSGKRLHGACLVNGDCLSSERCLVVPKGDGFATAGLCVDACRDDLECPAQQRCEPFSVSGQTLGPRREAGPVEAACVPGVREDGGL